MATLWFIMTLFELDILQNLSQNIIKHLEGAEIQGTDFNEMQCSR